MSDKQNKPLENDDEHARIEFALSALNLALNILSNLGYEIPQKLEFVKKNCHHEVKSVT